MAVNSEVLVPFSGNNEVARSNLRPLAICFSSSTWVRSTFAVVQVWVRVRPWCLRLYLDSRSPAMRAWASLTRATLKDTPEDVAVLTSRAVPLMGKSLPRRSFEDFPRSYNDKKNASETKTRDEMGSKYLPGGWDWLREGHLRLS